MRVNLIVPFPQTNKAKKAGAKFDPRTQTWFVENQPIARCAEWMTEQAKIKLGITRAIEPGETLLSMEELVNRYSMRSGGEVDQGTASLIAKRIHLAFKTIDGKRKFSVVDAPRLFQAIDHWQKATRKQRQAYDFFYSI